MSFAGAHNHLGAQVRQGPLRILFPREGATFLRNEHLPPTQQTLTLQSAPPGADWFLDGQKLDRPEIPLRRGTWTVSAKSGGETARVTFSVE